ncbi:CopG family transcriptional regulator [Paracoccus aurantiacus]|uniref:CopG family transcriptional regulator n=1 Tax=Paracoccus aurantiacus TaxID=2599412 RepID=A0A5C6RN61_9RHOB|nr:CopG family transcriptional regulator [Paracoccus aurantiacus]MAM41124.1 CopG family transcriptional regulator [Erythrobacter sp.]TXB63848.1 CopG family transcriptional regulator [Paracoccus aurantiacus]|tara:strand:+ start:531 stop:947 length:417 start_codon:yes stop_codon:yes gene_type:complete
MADIHRLPDRQADPEKITINLGHVDLGRIDLLVREGVYANRTDFIRTAIRAQLREETETVERSVARHQLELGLFDLTREALEAVVAQGEALHLKVLGLARIASDVSPELAVRAIGSIQVLGALQAPKDVKAALKDRIT